ncbi:hypothetical protein LCGC14_1991040, partial [marine sediment metagenome]
MAVSKSSEVISHVATTFPLLSAVPTIVHRLNQDGSESTQLFFGRKELSA